MIEIGSIDPRNNICAVLKHADGSEERFYGRNIVTNDGDKYYAQQGANQSSIDPTFIAGKCTLQNPSSADSGSLKADVFSDVTTPIVTSGATQSVESNYPKADDTGNSENDGAEVDAVTYKFTWSVSQINTAAGDPITGGCIVDPADVTTDTPAGASKLLTHWNFTNPASFHKTNTDTLTLYVNHIMNGTT